MTAPTRMRFGDVEIISPDGTDKIPAELWPELQLLMLLQPEPAEVAKWTAKLEAFLGVTDLHRAYVAGGEAGARSFIRDQRSHATINDEWSRVDPDMPFPGEGPEPTGHALAQLEGHLSKRRISGVLPTDERLAWYIGRAATRREKQAEANLIERGYAVYVPRLTRWGRVGNGARSRVEQSLFGGYFFVGLGREQALGDVVDTDCVHDLIRSGGFPRRVAFPPIAALIEMEINGEFDKTDRRHLSDPPKGTPVKILKGQWKPWPAKFQERREDERIVLLLQGIGGGKPATHIFEPEDIELPGGES